MRRYGVPVHTSPPRPADTTSRYRAYHRARLVRALLEAIAPTRCAGCERYGELWCDRCASELAEHYDPALACPRCGAPFGALLCTECVHLEWSIEHTVALGPLEGQLARAVVLHKDHNEQRLGPLLGAMLGTRVTLRWTGWQPDVVTWVPPSASALKRRGFDHGFSIADGVGASVGCRTLPLLARNGDTDLRSLGKGARRDATRSTYGATGHISGSILLVDDVLTSGSTAAECTVALLNAGATEVRLAVVARAW